MSLQVIELGEVEQVEVSVIDIRRQPLIGKTDLFVRVKKSNGDFLDWNDGVFKNPTSVVQLDQQLGEVNATYAPGLYSLAGGFDSGALSGLAESEDLTFFYLQDPGTDAVLPLPKELKIRPGAATVIGMLSRILGLLHENAIVDNQTYDDNGALLTSRVRVFDSAANVPSIPGGDESTGLLFVYSVIAGYSEGLLDEFKIVRVT